MPFAKYGPPPGLRAKVLSLYLVKTAPDLRERSHHSIEPIAACLHVDLAERLTRALNAISYRGEITGERTPLGLGNTQARHRSLKLIQTNAPRSGSLCVETGTRRLISRCAFIDVVRWHTYAIRTACRETSV
jgi:hypothetical protein